MTFIRVTQLDSHSSRAVSTLSASTPVKDHNWNHLLFILFLTALEILIELLSGLGTHKGQGGDATVFGVHGTYGSRCAPALLLAVVVCRLIQLFSSLTISPKN